MMLDDILQVLRQHEPSLRADGIAGLSLFGSVARGEDLASSDIDLLAVFDDAQTLSLLDVISLENRLSDLLGRKVDLVEERTLRSAIREAADRDRVRAF